MCKIISITILFLLIGINSHAQSVSFTVTTVTDNGNFSPKHVLAIWVEKADGTFVRSMKIMADKRKQYLYTWNAKSGGNVVDATTGATLLSHQTHTISWNCLDANKNKVPNGDYKMFIEFTDQHAQGPKDSVSFKISASAQHLTPASKTYFKDKVLDFTPVITGINSKIENQYLSVYPNPSHGEIYVNYQTEEKGPIQLKVYDAKGSIILNRPLTQNELENYVLQIPSSKPGTYIIEIVVNKNAIRQKVAVD